MKKLLTLIFLLPFLIFSQGNRYSYSFSGEIDSTFVEQISFQITQLEGVEQAKGRYKVDKMKGEIIIFTKESKDKIKIDENSFNPSLVKEIFIKNKLTPLDFRKLN